MTGDERTWPAGRALAEGESLLAACEGCDARWRVHRNLAGFRFACDACGGWVHVPQPDAPTPLQLEAASALQSEAGAREVARLDPTTRPIEELETDADGLVRLEAPTGTPYRGAIPAHTPLAPGSLRYALESDQRRWTTRTGLEIGAMLIALLAPYLATILLFSEREAAVLLPLTSLLGGLLVIFVGLASPAYTFGGLRGAKPRTFLIATAIAGGLVAAAVLWVGFIESSGVATSDDFAELNEMLGVPLLLAVMAVAPAIFEELAFRGLLQGRLTALMGRLPGIYATAALFTLAHGISYGSPLHLAAGVALGFLRDRSGSLLPGMLLHLLYNGSLVLLEIA